MLLNEILQSYKYHLSSSKGKVRQQHNNFHHYGIFYKLSFLKQIVKSLNFNFLFNEEVKQNNN